MTLSPHATPPQPAAAPFRVASGARMDGLDTLRGMAALAVAAFHFAKQGDYLGASSLVSTIAAFGHLGVDVFFVISGFVIPWSLAEAGYRPSELGRFLYRRFLRLYPAYIATCALVILLWYASSVTPGFRGAAPTFSASQLAHHLTLTCTLAGEPWLNPVFWTLAVEGQYYVLIACCFPLLIASRAFVRIAGVLAWLVAPLVLPWHPWVFSFCALFGLGIVAFLWRRAAVSLPTAIALLVIGAAVEATTRGWPSATVAAATAIVIGSAISFGPKVGVGLGTISYSVYLLHVPIGGRVINLFERAPAGSVLRYVGYGLAFAVTLAVAYAFYLAVEGPSHRLARRSRG